MPESECQYHRHDDLASDTVGAHLVVVRKYSEVTSIKASRV